VDPKLLILAAMRVLGAREHVPVNEELATSIAAAVEGEPDAELWALRAVVYTYAESRWGYHWDGRALTYDDCPAGDGGRALGLFQLQHTPAVVACHSAPAAREWLALAHHSERMCQSLAALVSGRCDRGTRLARSRESEVTLLLAEVRR
jgi:hypothetical protein